MPAPFKVDRQDTLAFSRVWTKNGLAVPMNDFAIDFANDYANVVINQFILLCAQQAQARAEAQAKAIEEANKPQIVLG